MKMLIQSEAIVSSLHADCYFVSMELSLHDLYSKWVVLSEKWLPIMVSLILQFALIQAVTFPYELPTASDSPSKRAERWRPDGFISSRQKQSEHNQYQSPGGFTGCFSMKEAFWVWSYDAEKSMGLFFAPLNPEKPLAVVRCHWGRWVGKCGRNCNGDWLGNDHWSSSHFFCRLQLTKLFEFKTMAASTQLVCSIITSPKI